jgi:hypothetical protein
MRRVSLVLLGGAGMLMVAGAGCDAVKNAFSPRAETVARANDQTLTVERMGDWAGAGKQVPLDPMALSRLAHVWVDYALLAQSYASGQDLRDSATMATAMWPLVSQLKWERFHDTLTAQGSNLSVPQVDSAFQAGQLRMFQHILFQVPPNSPPAVDAEKRRMADQLLSQARSAGRGFGRLATRYSDDNGSKEQGGSLGVSARGQFVTQFDDAAWQLGPGEVSPVVKTPFGYHIIRRPPLTEVRDSFKTGLEERQTFRGDSVYLDSLTIKRRVEPVSRAPTIVRAAVQDLEAARASSRTLVKYRGGAFRERDLARWLAALDPNVAQALPQATDEQINQFLKALVQRQLLLQQADSAKITLTAEDWQMLRAQHDSGMSMLASILNLTPQMLRDSISNPAERINFAMARVNDYMNRVVQGRARIYPVPPFLAEALRARAKWSVDEAGVRRSLERAQQQRTAADSLRAPGVPRMTPAPGGPPIDTTRRRPNR